MEKLVKAVNDPNSNSSDITFEVANTETNAEFFNDCDGTTISDFTTYFENKGFVAVSHDDLAAGEYTVYTRPKHRPRN